MLDKIFSIIDTCFYKDPRREHYNEAAEEKQMSNTFCNQTLRTSGIMQLVVLGTIS